MERKKKKAQVYWDTFFRVIPPKSECLQNSTCNFLIGFKCLEEMSNNRQDLDTRQKQLVRAQ